MYPDFSNKFDLSSVERLIVYIIATSMNIIIKVYLFVVV
jgi:hypothetical protein